MAIGANLERRGAVYYRRKRLPKGLALRIGANHVRLSLRTREVREARYLAASLNARAAHVLMNDTPQIGRDQLDLDPDEARAIEVAQGILANFTDVFDTAHMDGFRAKIGLQTKHADDAALIGDLLARMDRQKADFTLTFRGLGRAAESDQADASLRLLFDDPTAYDDWAARWRARLATEPREPGERRVAMDSVNPAIIPRNHRVEDALAAALAGDLAPFERLNEALAKPFEGRPDFVDYASLPPARDAAYRTFCGT